MFTHCFSDLKHIILYIILKIQVKYVLSENIFDLNFLDSFKIHPYFSNFFFFLICRLSILQVHECGHVLQCLYSWIVEKQYCYSVLFSCRCSESSFNDTLIKWQCFCVALVQNTVLITIQKQKFICFLSFLSPRYYKLLSFLSH